MDELAVLPADVHERLRLRMQVMHAGCMAGDLRDGLVRPGDGVAPVAGGHGGGDCVAGQAARCEDVREQRIGARRLLDALVAGARGDDAAFSGVEERDLDGAGAGVDAGEKRFVHVGFVECG